MCVPPPTVIAMLACGRLQQPESALVASDPVHKVKHSSRRYRAAAVKVPVASGFQGCLTACQTGEMAIEQN